MNLSFTDEQQMLADTAAAFAKREHAEPWKEIAELGWTELGVLDTAIVCEQLGKGAFPSALVTHAAARQVTGDGAWATFATDAGLVPFAAEADVVIVGDARIVDPSSAPRASLSNDPIYAVDGERTPHNRDTNRAQDVAAVCALAHATGAAERALEMSVQHARDREQFGRPIGSFQAVAHRCVDMRADVDACRYLAYQAAWALDRGGNADAEVGSALAYGIEAARRTFMHAHQVHGAIGFSTEHDLHRFTRIGKTFELLYGRASRHRERVAQAMGL